MRMRVLPRRYERGIVGAWPVGRASRRLIFRFSLPIYKEIGEQEVACWQAESGWNGAARRRLARIAGRRDGPRGAARADSQNGVVPGNSPGTTPY